MSSGKEILPQQGELYQEETLNPVLCKAKLMPLKSITLQKLEKMQKEAQETVKREEMEDRKFQTQVIKFCFCNIHLYYLCSIR